MTPVPTVHHGDCLEVLRSLPDSSIDAVVTDPPYALSFMGKAWDSHDTPIGFQAWCQLWAVECLRVLKPGGHLLAFGGTRTWHRLACAVEDAGFEVRDSIAWMYGSGFPKSLDVSKAIDKRGGNAHLAAEIAVAIKDSRLARGWTTGQADRHFCGGSTNWTWFEGRKGECRPPTPETFARIAEEWPELASLAEKVAEADRDVVGERGAGMGSGKTFGMLQSEGNNADAARVVDITAPATDAARTWQGWGTAMKPAHEPVVVARKPLVGTVAGNVLTHGTGALNIDGCRVGDESTQRTRTPGDFGIVNDDGWIPTPGVNGSPAGRWPANVILDEDQANALDQQSGVLKNGGQNKVGPTGAAIGAVGITERVVTAFAGDSGGASRFFYVAREDQPCPNPSLASTAEETSSPPASQLAKPSPKVSRARYVASPPATSSTMPTSRAPGALDSVDARFKYVAKAPKKERPVVDGTAHPTVKPIALMRWLVRLVTPPGGTVLEPFAGSGTTVEACILEGFNVIAIEREADYLPLIQSRIFRAQAAVAVEPEPDLFSELDGEAS